MNAYKIEAFSNYVLRTASFPLINYLKLLENFSNEALLAFYKNPFFEEAIGIASIELKTAIDKWIEAPNSLSKKKKEALVHSILKYTARISSRSTPFGLFAGCSVGSLANETNITLKNHLDFLRFTRFDMHYWVALLQDFANKKKIAVHLTFYPNNTLYVVGDFYRYIEYNYVNSKREHCISSLRKSNLLDELFAKAQFGISLHEMLVFLVDDDSEKEEALEFIYELINMQFLVSNLEAGLTAIDEWTRLFEIIKNIPELEKEYKILKQLKQQLSELDKKVVPPKMIYNNCKKLLQQIDIPFDEKMLYQTDLRVVTAENTLNKNVSKKIINALYFLNGIQPKVKNSNLENFKSVFLSKYESQELPLAFVLDTEIGIGYIQDNSLNDDHPILDIFSFKQKSATEKKEVWTEKDLILESKLQQCKLNSELSITITEKDFPSFASSWNLTPVTFSALIEVVSNNGQEQIVLCSSGNDSATKLLGRFCDIDSKIHSLVTEIIAKENDFSQNKILAEIVHIPESHTGNILKRPALRDYEIPYLSNYGVTLKKTILVNDLMISIKNGNIHLRSKKHNKEILPCLSNAHNFSSNSLPVYHFLCDMQSQNVKPIYRFDWGVLESHHNFFPQIVYKEVILAKAKWIVIKKELEQFKNSGNEIVANFTNWRLSRFIPRYVNWIYHDNSLLFDFEQLICVELFLKSVANYAKVTLEEFLFTSDLVVKNEKGEGFVNQFILSFYKEQL